MKKTLRFTLEVEVEILGPELPCDALNDIVISQLNETFPSIVIGPDDGADVLFDSWCYEAVKQA